MKDFDYHTLIHMLDEMNKEDRKVLLKISLATAVLDNISIEDYDDEGLDEVCARIEKVLNTRSDWPDFDSIVYHIQNLIDEGEYETPTEECIVEAYELAKEQCL